MSQVSPQMRKIAQRLVTYETGGNKSSHPPAFLVCDKLRPHLATLMGQVGFRALLSRALALAGAEAAWLRGVQVKADGTLAGLEELAAKVGPKEMAEGKVVLVTQLLRLLVAFIGEKLTLQLVGEIWPELFRNDLNSGKGAKHEKTK